MIEPERTEPAPGGSGAETRGGAPAVGSLRGGAGRDLLFGLLAFQNRFIDREALLGAFDAWSADRARGLGGVLLERGALSPERYRVLEALVEEHVRLHHGDPEESLAALDPVGPIRDELSRSTDPEVRASLARLPVATGDGRPGRPGATVTWPPPDERNGVGARFRIIRPHARGGLGEVFVALDTELNRDVALKEIQAELADDPRYRARFEFEAEVTGGLEHPGIVPVYALGHTPDGRPYYAMRFVKGESLKAATRRHREARGRAGRSTLALRELLGRFRDVCDAIAYAHSRGILHRDIKPSNIMLGPFGETLVVDWGVAKAIDRGEPGRDPGRPESPLSPRAVEALEPTMPGAAMGTPEYMSPEQAAGRGDELGIRSDVFGLGATLYYVLTGRAPCEAEDRGEVYRKVLAGEIPRPRTLDPTVPRPLEAICLKALARDPAGRYESAQALKADLDRWLADEPVLAYPEPFAARAMRRVRRHRPAVVAAAVLLLMATLGLALHDWQLGREEARTAEQLGMTRLALRQLLGLAGGGLAEIPNTHPLRQDLARLVLGQYRNLGEKFPGDPGVRLETAQVLRVIAGIERLTGRFTESDRSYEQAIEVLFALCAEYPGEFEYRRWLVAALHERGELYHMNGRVRSAEEWIGRAIAESRALLARPGERRYRMATGLALSDLSEILVLQGRPQEALRRADEAVALLEPIVREDPAPGHSGQNRWQLSLALTARGAAAREAGDEAAAARDLDEAEAVGKLIPPEDPYYDDLRFQLARIRRQRGERLGPGSPAPADLEPALGEALERLEELSEKNKLMPQYEEEMAATHLARAGVRLALHRPADALDDCQAAIARLEHLIGDRSKQQAPEHPGYLSMVGQAHLLAARIHRGQGRHQEARPLRDRGAQDLRRAIAIDGARALDAKLLEQAEAPSGREPDRTSPGGGGDRKGRPS